MRSISWDGDLRITQPFGCTTLTVEPYWSACPTKHKHCGIDVATVLNTPLYFPRAGRVSWIGYGLLASSNATQTDWFVHIDRAARGLSVGDVVEAGELAAYSGNKVPGGGATTGPHTHFEVQDWPRPRFAYYDANGRLIRPPGSLNNPATCVDPKPILEGRFSSGAGSLEDDMTDDEHKVLYTTLTLVRNLYFALGLPVVNPTDPADAKSPILDKLQTSIDGLAPAPPVDLSGLTVVNAKLDVIAGGVAAIKEKTDRDLA